MVGAVCTGAGRSRRCRIPAGSCVACEHRRPARPLLLHRPLCLYHRAKEEQRAQSRQRWQQLAWLLLPPACSGAHCPQCPVAFASCRPLFDVCSAYHTRRHESKTATAAISVAADLPAAVSTAAAAILTAATAATAAASVCCASQQRCEQSWQQLHALRSFHCGRRLVCVSESERQPVHSVRSRRHRVCQPARSATSVAAAGTQTQR